MPTSDGTKSGSSEASVVSVLDPLALPLLDPLELPELLLPLQKRPYHALKEREKEKAKERRKKLAMRSREFSIAIPGSASPVSSSCSMWRSA